MLLIHSGESGDTCGACSLGEMGACCVGSAEAACLAIFSSFLRFRSLKGCVTVIPAVRQVEWCLLMLRSSGPSCVTMWNRDVSGGRVCGCIPESQEYLGAFLAVQWLRLHAPNAGGWGSIPGQGTRSHMLQLRVCILQLKIPSAATGRRTLEVFLGGQRESLVSLDFCRGPEGSGGSHPG